MWFDPLMTGILRSPLHGMLSKNMMLISFSGRRSGHQITTPVSYLQDADGLWVVSFRSRNWWRNFIGGAPASLLLRGREVKAFGEAITEESAVTARLAQTLEEFPAMGRYLGIRMQAGTQPDPDKLAQAARTRVYVHIQPEKLT